MKLTGVALLTAAIAGWVSLAVAHAAPPTVSPSPGYDARLQEQRAATRIQEPLVPVVKPVPPRRGKKPPAN